MLPTASYQTLRRLAYFAAIADVGSIRGAATRLDLSVPVVSTALAELEAELNLALAIRSTRRLTLTPAGEEISRLASRMLAAADQAIHYAANDRPLTGKLAITLPVELASYWLPARLMQFHRQHPDVALQIEASDRRVDLQKSAFDIAIRATHQKPWLSTQNVLNSNPHNQIALICIAQSQPNVTWDGNKAMIDAVLLTSLNEQWLGAIQTATVQPIRLVPSRVLTINNKETAIAMARQGLGCALVIVDAVKTALARQQLVSILPELDFGFLTLDIVLRDNLPSPEARAFGKFLENDVLTATE
ncbi:MAG: LysR family transcriptional regulator [Cyanobacteria bacterium P01_G01_bin.54]